MYLFTIIFKIYLVFGNRVIYLVLVIVFCMSDVYFHFCEVVCLGWRLKKVSDSVCYVIGRYKFLVVFVTVKTLIPIILFLKNAC